MKNISFTITLIVLTCSLQAQLVDQSYFRYGGQGVIHHLYQSIESADGVIVSGADTTGDAWAPVVVKVSNSGDIIWGTAGSYFSDILGCYNVNLFQFSDGFIYVVPEYYLGSSQYTREIWKVDPSNGNVMWHFEMPISFNKMIALDEFDEDDLIVGYIYDNTHCKMAYLDKSTGVLSDFATLASVFSDVSLVVDDQKNILFGNGPYITKFNRNDLSQIIWTTRIYDAEEDDTLETVRNMYLDDYDELYVFSTGLMNSSFGGYYNLSRLNTDDGSLQWNAQVSADENFRRPYVDRYDKFYLTFQHGYVGGGSYVFNCTKVDKSTGVIDWVGYYNITPVGSPSGTSGNGQSALHLDLDCYGDVYMTGYYGDANYGPEQWGTMKASGETGEKLYDFTTAIDLENYSNLSEGNIMFVKQNQPMMLGQLQDVTDEVNITYVKFDATDGSVLDQHYLNDSAPLTSSAVEILGDSDASFVLKQVGKMMRVERYDDDANLIWSQAILSEQYLIAGGMTQDEDYLYVVASDYSEVLTPPYYNPNAESMIFYKFSKSDGQLLLTQQLPINFGLVRILDVEADASNCYVVYSKSGIIWYCRWDGFTISTPQQHEVAGVNAAYDGKLDFLEDSGSDFYYLFGNAALYALDKTSLSKTVIYNYAASIIPYDMDLVGTTIYLAGQHIETSQPYLAAVDAVNNNLLWSKQIELTGSIFQLEVVDTSVFYIGQMENQTAIGEYSMNADSVMWNHQSTDLGANANLPLDLSVSVNHRYLAVGGKIEHSDSWSDNLIIMKGFQGENLYQLVEEDGYFLISQARVTEILNDSICWIGGSLNESSNGKQGYIYTLYADGPEAPDHVEEFASLSDIGVYPNPASSIISLKNIHRLDRIEIYHASGELVKTMNNCIVSDVDVSMLSQGQYTISLVANGIRQSIPFQIVR